MMTKAQFNRAVKRLYGLDKEREELRQAISAYMVENFTTDEVVEQMEEEKELAVTYSDGYISSRLDTTKAKELLTAVGIVPPINEVTVACRLAVKVRKRKDTSK